MIVDDNGSIRAGAEALLSVAGEITRHHGDLATAKALAAASATVLACVSDEDAETWFSVVRQARDVMRKAEASS